MSPRNYLCVFHAAWISDELKDIGDDPCFDYVPTWGICRPNVRKSIKIGERLFFVGYVQTENKYYVKGWFEVGEKISYEDALSRFPGRANVIISRLESERDCKWRDRKLKRYFEASGRQNPDFLKVIVSQEGEFFQSPIDEHEIDNWKCRRIFHCRSKTFKSCVDLGRCQLNGTSLKLYSNYVVANPNCWAECGNLKIDFDELRAETGFSKPLRTPKGQHNVLSLYDVEINRMIDYLKCRTQ
jgi:hypothetical protein